MAGKQVKRLEMFCRPGVLEAGVDEVGRGCLIGRVYTAAVILPAELDPDFDHPIVRDSKKLSKRRRETMVDYIKETALDYAVAYKEPDCIDRVNILRATHDAMHGALNALELPFEHILVDGNAFRPYTDRDLDFVEHTLVVKGDDTYMSIACASILAKVARDTHVEELCETYPELEERYGLLSNMGYGTARHRQGIEEHGITQFHRRSFGLCKTARVSPVVVVV